MEPEGCLVESDQFVRSELRESGKESPDRLDRLSHAVQALLVTRQPPEERSLFRHPGVEHQDGALVSVAAGASPEEISLQPAAQHLGISLPLGRRVPANGLAQVVFQAESGRDEALRVHGGIMPQGPVILRISSKFSESDIAAALHAHFAWVFGARLVNCSSPGPS